MAVIETWYRQDLTDEVKVHYFDGNLFSDNGNGNRIGVELFNHGEALASISGTVSGYVVTPDGSTVPCTGSKSANKASILIPASAYQPGNVFITIFLTDGTSVTTLAAVAANVLQAKTGSQVDPGSVVTDWTQTINAAMQAVETAAENIGGLLAVPYDSITFPVPFGKYTFYNNKIYRCIVPITSSESFTSAHWTQVRLGDDISDIKSIVSRYSVSNLMGQKSNVYYKVDIKQGEKFTISTSDGSTYPSSEDLKVYLYDSAKNVISNHGFSAVSRTITAPSNGSDVSYLLYNKDTVVPLMVAIGENAAPYQPYFPNLLMHEETSSKIISQIEKYGAENICPYKESWISGNVTFTYVENGKYKVTASSNTSIINLEVFRSTNSFPEGFSAGKTYRLYVENDYPSGIGIQFRPYVSGTYLNDVDKYYVSSGYKEITIPSDATGLLIRVYVEANSSFSNKYISLFTSEYIIKQGLKDSSDLANEHINDIYVGGDDNYQLVFTTGKYISSSTGQVTSGGSYQYSAPVKVRKGDKILLSAKGSGSVFVLAMYENEDDATAILTKSIAGTDDWNERTAIVPAGVNYVRLCCNTTGGTPYAKVSLPSLNTLSNEVDYLKGNETENRLLKKRKATVSFIFDDGNYKDAQIKAIFDNNHMKCGFAVYGDVPLRYVDYHADGFEILAHDVSLEQTESAIKQQLVNCYNNIVSSVGVCYGWVTPSSVMPENYRPLVYDVYEYGYTIYKGNVSTPSDACMDKTIKTYSLWRSSLQVLTLAQQKAIVDYAVANNLLICFYGHAADLDTDDYLTTDNLNALLAYCASKGITVETPHDSMLNYMSFRHNEDT